MKVLRFPSLPGSYAADVAAIKHDFEDRVFRDISRYPGLVIEQVEIGHPFWLLTAQTPRTFASYAISMHYSTGDVVDLLKAIDRQEWTIYEETYFAEEMQIDIKLLSTNLKARLYKVSVNQAAAESLGLNPLHAVSILHDANHPYFYTVYRLILESEDPAEDLRILTYIE